MGDVDVDDAWERYWRMAADPVVVDGEGRAWVYADWDFGRHEPRLGAQPRR